MLKKGLIAVVVLLALTLIYALGPAPDKPEWPAYDEIPALNEDTSSGIKPGNGSRTLGPLGENIRTRYVLLYLHGFSACPEEGFPVLSKLSDSLKMNAYAPRLFSHGLNDKESMLGFNNRDYWISACRALQDASRLGDSIIVVGTSTGATLALLLANRFPAKVQGLILYSPNIELFDSRSWLLSQPYGLYIARLVKGSKYHEFSGPEGTSLYWNTKYRLEALVELQNILENGMTPELFRGIKAPLGMFYYYKNEKEQDDVVSVAAMLRMYETIGTPEADKMKFALPDAGVHAIPSGIWNPNAHEVALKSIGFLKARFSGI